MIGSTQPGFFGQPNRYPGSAQRVTHSRSSQDSNTKQQSLKDSSDTSIGNDEWIDRFRNWEDVGPYGEPGYAFGEKGHELYHKRMFRQNGFDLDTVIARVDTNLFDNQVWKVKHITTGNVFACKVVSLKYYHRRDFCSGVNAMLRESYCLIHLDHQNIIKLIKVFGLKEPTTGFPYSFQCTVMELMDGTLQSLQDSYIGKRMDVAKAREWFVQIARGVDYLHNRITSGKRVSHIAIRPVNILYKILNHQRDTKVFKLADFEESITFESGANDNFPFRGYRGNEWSPPEMARGNAFRNGGVPTKPIDVYSLGFTLCTNVCGYDPWPTQGYIKWIQGRLPNNMISDNDFELYNSLAEVGLLFTSMINPDASQRPAIEEVLSDPWVTQR